MKQVFKNMKPNSHGLRNIPVYRFEFAIAWAGSMFTDTGMNLPYF